MPSPLLHPVLGPLTYNEALGWFETKTPDGVGISVNAEDGVPVGTAVLDRIAAERPALTRAAADHATAALLDLKNDVWLDEDEADLTPEAFRARLALEGIVVRRDGAEFYFHDGDLFWGHVVLVDMDEAGAFSDAHIAG